MPVNIPYPNIPTDFVLRPKVKPIVFIFSTREKIEERRKKIGEREKTMGRCELRVCSCPLGLCPLLSPKLRS